MLSRFSIYICMVVLVVFSVSEGLWWLPTTLLATQILFRPMARAYRLGKRFFARVDRLEVAWLLSLFATLSIDTLSPDDVFSGNLRSAQLVRLALLAATLLLLIPNLRRWGLGAPNGIFNGTITRIYGAFLAVALASTAWSPGRFATAGKALEVLVAFLVILAIAAQPDGERKLQRVFYITLVFIGTLLTMILIGYVLNPSMFTSYIRLADKYTLSGGFLPIAANAIARFGSIIAVVAVALLLSNQHRRHGGFLVFLVIFGGAFPILAEGRTGLASFLLTIAILVATQRFLLGFLLAIPTSIAIPYLAGSFWEFFRRGQNIEQFSGLSGRVGWWEAALQKFLAAPITGYGFGVGGRAIFSDLGRETTSGLHNGFLETALGVGTFGFLLWLTVFLLVIVKAGRQILAKRNTHLYAIAIPLLLATMLSSGVGGWMSPELGLYLILMVHLDLIGRRHQKRYRSPAALGPRQSKLVVTRQQQPESRASH